MLILCLCGVAVFAPGDDPSDTRERTTKPEAAALAASATSSPAAANPADSPAPRPKATTSSKPTATKKASAKPVYYANCDAVQAAGKAPLFRGQPGYRRALDRDGDGVACEPYGDDDPPPADPGGDPPAGGTDPRFPSCKKAIDAGYGPYRRGDDPEYEWYLDRDGDGVVCES